MCLGHLLGRCPPLCPPAAESPGGTEKAVRQHLSSQSEHGLTDAKIPAAGTGEHGHAGGQRTEVMVTAQEPL